MKPKGRPQTLIARRIMKEHTRLGFVGAIISAPRGYGKSSFAIKTLFDLYHNGYGLGVKEAYDKALSQILYNLPEITKRIKENLEHDEPTEALIFDDAGIYLSGQAYGLYVRWHALLKGFLDTVRLATSCVLMTTPNVKDLAAYVRRHDDNLIRIKKTTGSFERIAVTYSQYTLPSGTVRVKKIGETDYSCYLPDNIYKKYTIKRKQMLVDITNEMAEKIEQDKADAIVYDGLHGYKRREGGKKTKKEEIMTEFYNGTKLSLKGLARKYNTSYPNVKNIHAVFLRKTESLL